MYGGAAAAIAGAAGAAYLSWNQINAGLTWAGSHLEFVGCLARGAELQKRVESVVNLTETHNVGFADFYTALSEKVSSKTEYAGYMVGQERTFCVVPKETPDSPTGSKRSAPSSSTKTKKPPPKKRRTKQEEEMNKEMEEGEKVQAFAQDTSKRKGEWVRCVNEAAKDELRAHTSMFNGSKNPGYHNMLPLARDKIVGWVDKGWYEGSDGGEESKNEVLEEVEGNEGAGAEEGEMEDAEEMRA